MHLLRHRVNFISSYTRRARWKERNEKTRERVLLPRRVVTRTVPVPSVRNRTSSWSATRLEPIETISSPGLKKLDGPRTRVMQTVIRACKKPPSSLELEGGLRMYGAGNGIRTRDSQLGKLILYQLSYARLDPDDASHTLSGQPGTVNAIIRRCRRCRQCRCLCTRA